MTTTEVQTSIDPTLLFSGYEWLKMCGLDSRPKKKYILLYLVAEPLNLIQYIENKSHELGYDVIEISHKLKKTSNEFSLKRKCGPKEFINLILNAEYIATTSFHATAFSILFHKKMFVEMVDKTGKYNVRISDLFSKLKINKISNNDIWIVENNDWELTDRKISKTRDESQAYLQQIISDN